MLTYAHGKRPDRTLRGTPRRMRKVTLPEEVLVDVFGHYDENLKTIEKEIHALGDERITMLAQGEELAF